VILFGKVVIAIGGLAALELLATHQTLTAVAALPVLGLGIYVLRRRERRRTRSVA